MVDGSAYPIHLLNDEVSIYTYINPEHRWEIDVTIEVPENITAKELEAVKQRIIYNTPDFKVRFRVTDKQGYPITIKKDEPMTAATYRKKPVEIQAMRFGGTFMTDDFRLLSWMADNLYPMLIGDYTKPDTLRYHDQVIEDDSRPDKGVYIDPTNGNLMIRTLEGDMRAAYGDYVIKGVQGQFYPCKPDIFEATYERMGVRDE